MQHHGKDALKKGFFWLGSANLVTRIIDLASNFILLFFLTRQEMGVAALAWSIAVVVEACNGMGISQPLLQIRELTRNQLDSAWWYVSGVALLAAGVAAGAAPFIASFYNNPVLVPMVVVSAVKLFFVGWALIPLQMLNRELKFKEIGAINTLATLLASILTIVLAVGGTGAWAPVLGQVAHGFFTLLGAMFFSPFWPRRHFRYAEIRVHVHFGIKVAISNIIGNFSRNVDFLIVGKLLGEQLLGVYKVAFDIAMSPAMSLLHVVSRTAFPVFARMQDSGEELKKLFLWVQRNLAFYLLPLNLLVFFAVEDILMLIGKGLWLPAVPLVRIMVWASTIRSLALVFPQLFQAVGRPMYALWNSLFTLVFLCGTLFGSIALLSRNLGLASVALAWLASYPFLLAILILMTGRIFRLTLLEYLKDFFHPVLMTAAMLAVIVPLHLCQQQLPLSRVLFPVLLVGAILGVAWMYRRHVMGFQLKVKPETPPQS